MRHGEARVLPGTGACFRADREKLASYEDIIDEPVRTWDDVRNDHTNYYEDTGTTYTFYRVDSKMAQPGEILAEMNFPNGKIIVSVPELPDDLTEYARSRGESWYMIYCRYDNSNMDCAEDYILSFYQEEAFVYVWCGETSRVFWACPTFNMASQVNWSLSSYNDRNTDQITVSCREGNFEKELFGIVCVDLETFNKEQIYYYDREDLRIVLGDDRAQFTETSYIPSSTQFALLKEMLTGFEAQPLPVELLE